MRLGFYCCALHLSIWFFFFSQFLSFSLANLHWLSLFAVSPPLPLHVRVLSNVIRNFSGHRGLWSRFHLAGDEAGGALEGNRDKEIYKEQRHESGALRNTTHGVLERRPRKCVLSFTFFFCLNVEGKQGVGSRCYSVSTASQGLTSCSFFFFHSSNFSWS